MVKFFKQADDEYPKTRDCIIMYVMLVPEGGRVTILGKGEYLRDSGCLIINAPFLLVL